MEIQTPTIITCWVSEEVRQPISIIRVSPTYPSLRSRDSAHNIFISFSPSGQQQSLSQLASLAGQRGGGGGSQGYQGMGGGGMGNLLNDNSNGSGMGRMGDHQGRY